MEKLPGGCAICDSSMTRKRKGKGSFFQRVRGGGGVRQRELMDESRVKVGGRADGSTKGRHGRCRRKRRRR